jgi:hypothetical protein
MKTFRQFLEQLETATQAAQLAAKKSASNTKMSALAGMRHRRHVHGELSRTASYETQQRREREKIYNPYA